LEERSHAASPDGFLALGVGDDAALARPRPGRQLVLTCDIHIEGRHFRRDLMTPRQAGRRVMVSNISDVAAMGGEPRAALISMALPPDDPVDVLFGLLAGLADELQDAGGVVAGGNLSATDGPRVVDVTLVGDVEEPAFLRSGARPGDKVILIGATGPSAAGFWSLTELVADSATGDDSARADEDRALGERAAAGYVSPQHRLAAARKLRGVAGVHAVIDTSDGLLADLDHVCQASGVGARIDTRRLPVAADLRNLSRTAGIDPLEWVLGPSDDYALVVTAEEEAASAVRQAVGSEARLIGRIVPGQGVELEGVSRLQITGWDHYDKG
ncbi:MAG: thiamine-phosphate kinase, partial [Candidatus Eisenbacteria bacterium]|nr:thiamine-phosphate kinase [Candidatus Eisenbacteria bacterium]